MHFFPPTLTIGDGDRQIDRQIYIQMDYEQFFINKLNNCHFKSKNILGVKKEAWIYNKSQIDRWRERDIQIDIQIYRYIYRQIDRQKLTAVMRGGSR